MTEWKAGDRAMVDIVEINGVSALIRRHGTKDHRTDVVRSDVFRPLPTDPHQALKDEVIEKAKAWGQAQRTERHLASTAIDLLKAVNALTAAENPPKPDPVEIMIEAMRGFGIHNNELCNILGATARNCIHTCATCKCRPAIASGLAAVEAARTAK